MKNIFILGVSGSIGKQTIQIIESYPKEFQLKTVSVGDNILYLEELLRNHPIEIVSVKQENDRIVLQKKYPHISFFSGDEGLIQVATGYKNHGVLVNAVVGMIGLIPTIKAIEAKREVLLANKETLVVGGDIIMRLAKQHNVIILPIDSEHSAIFQCLKSGRKEDVKRLIITASGGSFRELTREDLKGVTKQKALNHPNWSMGDKITIDSATMANKGLEVIEAHHLFDLPYDQIDTILHKESIIHSMVEYKDNSVIAQLSTTSMMMPIAYALFYPHRAEDTLTAPLDLIQIGKLHFQELSMDRFPLLKIAYEVGRAGGLLPAVYNASNEVAVSLFLQERISFLEIEKIVEQAVNNTKNISQPTLEEILEVDRQVRKNILEIYEVN